MSYIYSFDHEHQQPPSELAHLLGGKGAGLAEMTTALGVPVPPGFTISIPVCQYFRSSGWPRVLDTELEHNIADLSAQIGRRFGDPDDPLLIAVRSGAPVSMPGMLDTVLNLGLNEETVQGLADRSGDQLFAWDTYSRFLTMYATTVMGIEASALQVSVGAETAGQKRDETARLHRQIERTAGRPVPEDPAVQLRESIEAVFKSWNSKRAQTYRAKEEISEDLGTGVNIQAMVFGNRGDDSGTGVAFTRDPSTGENRPYGDYLPNAQGEDVVAGNRKTMPIAEMASHQPNAYRELMEVLQRLERHYRDVCDVEFTIEGGRLWLLQTRVGKRSPSAAVRIAVDMVDDPQICLSPTEALSRVTPTVRAKAREEILASVGSDTDQGELVTVGLGASPGRVSGRVVLNPLDAMDANDEVILVRRDTNPEDVAGMASSAGVLTTTGGLVSHAAVVARGWSIPAVVGACDLQITSNGVITPDGAVVKPDDLITIDGSSGNVWMGQVDATAHDDGALDRLLPELARLQEWQKVLEVARA